MEKKSKIAICFAVLFLAGWCAFLAIIGVHLRIQEFHQILLIMFSYCILLFFGFLTALGIYSYSRVYKDKKAPLIAVIIAWTTALLWAFSL